MAGCPAEELSTPEKWTPIENGMESCLVVTDRSVEIIANTGRWERVLADRLPFPCLRREAAGLHAWPMLPSGSEARRSTEAVCCDIAVPRRRGVGTPPALTGSALGKGNLS